MQNAFRQPVFLVLTAPSGAGKTTLVNRLRDEFGSFVYSVSCTTRAPRGEEKDGVAYHFLSDEEFLRRVADGQFLEHALVHGNRYGTLAGPVRDAFAEGQSVLMDIDVEGAAQVRDHVSRLPEDDPLHKGFLDIFIRPPGMEELRERLLKRGEDDRDVIERRLRNAEGELARAGEFSRCIVNDDLEIAYRELCGIIEVYSGLA